MGAAEWIAAGAAVVGVGVSIWAANKASAASKTSEAAKSESEAAKRNALDAIAKAEAAQSNIQMATLEHQLGDALSRRRDKIGDVEREMSEVRAGREKDQLPPEVVRRLDEIGMRYLAVHEDFLNSVERVCASYRDGKLDKERCKTTYFTTVRDIAEMRGDHPWNTLMHPQATSKFKAIWLVYDEWHNLEKAKVKKKPRRS